MDTLPQSLFTSHSSEECVHCKFAATKVIKLSNYVTLKQSFQRFPHTHKVQSQKDLFDNGIFKKLFLSNKIANFLVVTLLSRSRIQSCQFRGIRKRTGNAATQYTMKVQFVPRNLLLPYGWDWVERKLPK